MNFISPLPNTVFTISSGAVWPSVPFETDASGPHNWAWKIAWKTFAQSGVANTPANEWDAQSVVTDLGGILTVTAKAGDDSAATSVTIKGTNPSLAEATAFLATQANSGGFDKILQHETGFRNFAGTGEPVKSFDNGYGMCQLTTPPPSFKQAWNWQANIQGGLALFAKKRALAVAYLTQASRTATPDQILRETVSRWNGGSYHVWDPKTNAWIRNPNIVCDPATGNIGWDMTDQANTGKTVAVLHARDNVTYAHAPVAGSHWKYSGICYADRILG
jgi:hypothetical protein